MKSEEVRRLIKNIPLGSRIEIVTKAGSIFQVGLKRFDLGRHRNELNGISVPAVPEALILAGPTFGDWRLEIDSLAAISRVD